MSFLSLLPWLSLAGLAVAASAMFVSWFVDEQLIVIIKYCGFGTFLIAAVLLTIFDPDFSEGE